MKEREVVLRQRVLGSLAVSGSLSGRKYHVEPEIDGRVECTAKSGVPLCALGIGVLCKTSCIPSCCFLGIGEGVGCSFLFWFGFDPTERNIVCTHHGTDIQINSPDCLSLLHLL